MNTPIQLQDLEYIVKIKWNLNKNNCRNTSKDDVWEAKKIWGN